MSLGKVMVVHPGADWSIADVFSGMCDGLVANSVKVYPFQFGRRIDVIQRALHTAWEARGTTDEERGPAPNFADVSCWASEQAVTWALRHLPVGSWVIVVSAMFFHPDAYVMLRKAGYKVAVLFTESPYEVDKEIQVAAMVDKVWSNERCTIETFRQVNPTTTYLQHAWNPFVHVRMDPAALDGVAPMVPSHDVLFIGTGFKERIEWLEGMDWTGIDLGLYGTWDVDKHSPIKPFVKGGIVPNEVAKAAYQRAKINLNLFRWTKGWAGVDRVRIAESMNPRLYELAALGCFTLSETRPEVAEVFGTDLPTFVTSDELQTLLGRYLADDGARLAGASRLPPHVATHTWVERARQMVCELEAM